MAKARGKLWQPLLCFSFFFSFFFFHLPFVATLPSGPPAAGSTNATRHYHPSHGLHGRSSPPEQRWPGMSDLLYFLSRPAFSSIQSRDGDVIDCVPITRQPAFARAGVGGGLIRGHPPMRPRRRTAARRGGGGRARQVWTEGGAECPPGTVPVRRAAAGGGGGGRKGSRVAAGSGFPGGSHEHAIAFVSGGTYGGAKSTMNVWQPRVEEEVEFSISQMWVIAGPFNGELNTIEAGWQVSPQLYGDNRPRLFIYWTSDGYQQTGCYNLLCSGFVQTSNRIALGAAIAPVSSYGGPQYEIHLLIWKDPIHGDWWMEFGEDTLVGYWPASLFTHLRGDATLVEWGGEVVNNRPGGRHTSTRMGSGHFSWEGFGRASYFRNLELVDERNDLRPADGLRTTSDRASCYDIRQHFNSNWGSYFYYGGPGRNFRCP